MTWRSRSLAIASAGAAVLPLALAALAWGSCSLAELYQGFGDAGADGSGGAGGTTSTGIGGSDAGMFDADASDADGRDADTSDVHDGSVCPADMVTVAAGTSSFCIDRREVTNAEYTAFLASIDGAAPDPSGACAWNTSYSPAVPIDAGATLPVLGVDWCDAYAYCAWAKKRLCGAVGGGALAPEKRDLLDDQWWSACSHRGTEHYPYGNTFDITACADCNPAEGCDPDAASATSAATPVGSKTACKGGYSGLYDMSGNAWEWQEACGDAGVLPDASDEGGAPIRDPRYDTCFRRGGSFLVPRTGVSASDCLGCASISCKSAGDLRKNRPKDVGLRCCLDL